MERLSFNTHVQGRLAFNLFASQAEFERQLIKRGGERIASVAFHLHTLPANT